MNHGHHVGMNLSLDDLEWLASTRQLNPIVIRGKRRFLFAEIESLVKVYQSTEHRNPHAYASTTEEKTECKPG